MGPPTASASATGRWSATSPQLIRDACCCLPAARALDPRALRHLRSGGRARTPSSPWPAPRGFDPQSPAPAALTQVVGDRKTIAGALTNLLRKRRPGAGLRRRRDPLRGPAGRRLPALRWPTTAAALIRHYSRGSSGRFFHRPDGTGLGLAIAQGVARAHGGHRHRFEPGRGTVFSLTLAMGG